MGQALAPHLGIQIALSLEIDWAVFEMDSKVMVDMVHKEATHIRFLKPIPQEVMLCHFSDCLLGELSSTHIMKANKCAYLLTSKGHNVPYNGVIFHSSFSFLEMQSLADARGVSTSRIVP